MQTAGHPFPPENEVSLVRQYGPIYGTFTGLEPTLTVADPEAIKAITVKDFQYFVNRRQLKTFHEMNNISLIMTEDDKWKRIRAITSPAFTTKKLRSMQPIIQKSIDKLDAYLGRLVDKTTSEGGEQTSKCPFSGKGGIMETKKVLTGFTIDSIALAAFATETNANDDRSTDNTLVNKALKWNEAPALQAISAAVMPLWFNKLVGVPHLANIEVTEYMTKLVKEMVRRRKQLLREKVEGGQKSKGIVDLMQLLIDAEVSDEALTSSDYHKLTADMSKEGETSLESSVNSKNTNINRLTDNEIVSQCMLFFGAGFDTTASALTVSNLCLSLSIF